MCIFIVVYIDSNLKYYNRLLGTETKERFNLVVYRMYLNSTDKHLGLVGGLKVFFENLVRVVCVASPPRYRPMKYCSPYRVCKNLCASIAARRCVLRTAVHGSAWLVWPH
jgi:hypothetical protein